MGVSFINTFYFFINLDKMLRSTQSMGVGALAPLAPWLRHFSHVNYTGNRFRDLNMFWHKYQYVNNNVIYIYFHHINNIITDFQ